VSNLKRATGPEMDQELYTFGYMLHVNAKKMINKARRPSWMDGSDSDDEDQHSYGAIQTEIKGQFKPVYLIAVF
jgi:hypothetical protein